MVVGTTPRLTRTGVDTINGNQGRVLTFKELQSWEQYKERRRGSTGCVCFSPVTYRLTSSRSPKRVRPRVCVLRGVVCVRVDGVVGPSFFICVTGSEGRVTTGVSLGLRVSRREGTRRRRRKSSWTPSESR